MSHVEFPPERVVTRSGLILLGKRGLCLAQEVFTHYTMSTARVDTFAQLRVAYTPEINGKIILPTTLADFRNNGLITPASSSGSIGSLTEKGHVAISMVNVSGEGGDVDTWLDEPFMELEVLPILQDTRHPLALAVDEFRSEYERTNY